MTKAQLKKLYQEYLEEFDPTPEYLYDEYKVPMDFYEFSDCILHDEDPYHQ